MSTNKAEYYAIETIGLKGACAIKRVTNTGLVIPVDGRRYRNVDAAKAAAAGYGLSIEKIGDIYAIL